MDKTEYEKLLAQKDAECQKKIDQMKAEVEAKEKRMEKIIKDTYPMNYLASCYADAVAKVFDGSIKYLKKEHPYAKKSIDEVKRLKSWSKENAKTYKIQEYRYQLLLKTFPEAKEILEDDGNIIKGFYDSQKEDNSDQVANWLSKAEYNKLSETERNQKALDMYKTSRRRSKWQIGRDYELYCCYWLRKNKSLYVKHNGFLKQDDLGRDIIADDGMQHYVIQCKFWSKFKEVHENVVMQLYATTVEYTMSLEKQKKEKFMTPPKALLIANIELSETAKRIAKVLNVEYIKLQMGEYPMIKCNVGNNGSKIYHLPFDQQYDKVKILDFEKDMTWTVEEAEKRGFRRAKRYKFGKK